MTQTETLTARIDERLAYPVRPPVYVEIVDPSGRVSYRRWSDHPDVLEALWTRGYTVRRCPQQPDLEGEAHPDRALLVESAARIRDLEAQLAAQAEALAELRAENHNATQALIYAIQKHPDGQVCQDWSSWRVAYGRGVYRGCGRTDTQQLISAVCMATEHADPYAPEAHQ